MSRLTCYSGRPIESLNRLPIGLGPRAALLAVLKRLRGLGVQLSIGDFGTGYSSMSYLKRFPISALKIDRSFVCDLPGDRENAAITEAMIALARALNLKTVAEGVETRAQAHMLAAAGCDFLQGFLFSKPIPAPAFIEWWENGEFGPARHVTGETQAA